MKTLWNLISIVAVVNLLALISVVGWFVSTGKIDRERFEAIKALLEAPKEEPKKEEPKPEPKPDDGSRDTTPTDARITAQDRAERLFNMNQRRLIEETDQLSDVLGKREQAILAEQQKFEAERKAWEEATAAARDQSSAEQFRKAVKMLESVPPKQAKEWLLVMCGQSQVDQAVAYLDAMSPYKAASVMKSLKGAEEDKMAADLLERLRQRTIGAKSARANEAPAKSTPNAPSAANPSNSDAASKANTGTASGPRSDSGQLAQGGANAGGEPKPASNSTGK